MKPRIVPAFLIASCRECPHFGENDLDQPACNHYAEGYWGKRIDNRDTIPDWCPLDEAKEG